jgi:hypothetical protein
MAATHAELRIAVEQATATLDRKRAHLERAIRYLDDCPDGDPRKADAERRVRRLMAEKNVAETAAHAAADKLIAYEDAQTLETDLQAAAVLLRDFAANGAESGQAAEITELADRLEHHGR